MPDHPPETLTPAQARQVRWAFPYEQTPALSAKFFLFSEAVLTLAVALVQLKYSEERDRALRLLQEASSAVQDVFTLEEGTPMPPSWITIEEPEEPAP